MTKQEEIRNWLRENFGEAHVKVILDYLHSQGVVIKGNTYEAYPNLWSVESLINKT